jgi:hypothetical protein
MEPRRFRTFALFAAAVGAASFAAVAVGELRIEHLHREDQPSR